MPKFPFFPREEKFAVLFAEGAAILAKTAITLDSMLQNWSEAEEKLKQITELEHDADAVVHSIMANLHSTFITPFDREDIAALAHSLDDIIDFVQSAADAMVLYKITSPTPRSRELAAIIVEASNEVVKAISYLRKKSDLKGVLEHCVELNRLENSADTVYRLALGELFGNTTSLPDIIKWREIYEHLESATDRCEDVANVLEGVVLKNA